MPSRNYAIIRQAIIDKQQITATYHGLRREMCPHVIGTTDGREHALFYQFGGHSSRGLSFDGSPDNWRCMFVDELFHVTARPGRWHSAPEHTRHNNCVQAVDKVVRS
jgi:hypothetical protein